MGKCTICGHAEREAIDRALVRGEGLRALAERYGTSHVALFRHKRAHIPAELARVADAGRLAAATALAGEVALAAAREEAAGLNVLAELGATFRRVNKLFDACDRWLADPDDPERYDLGPRAEELLVHYWRTTAGGRRVRAKAPLATLLRQAAASRHGEAPPEAPQALCGKVPQALCGTVIEGVDLRSADPRELILKAAQRLEAELNLVARLLGLLAGQAAPAGPTVNVLVASPEWVTTRAAILAALEPYPVARAAVADAVRRAAGEG